jgi:hypothetical protein
MRLILVAFIFLVFGSGARSAELKAIEGKCWTRDIQRSVAVKGAPTSQHELATFCFRRDGKVCGAFLDVTGEGGDLQLKWKFTGRSGVTINGKGCGATLPDQDKLRLSECPYAGEWVRDPTLEQLETCD